ncbi:hypothetical protein L596_016542 [Steinernema carpocapsae]|uniref:Uncharacterized protein n=1 Tax=Steinernema carpocapsae TaxID=34508 RepID=A0A4U5NID5_STECR|nr:hypothetical protein L596_016542 [Steinernema carpocapsae]
MRSLAAWLDWFWCCWVHLLISGRVGFSSVAATSLAVVSATNGNAGREHVDNMFARAVICVWGKPTLRTRAAADW